MRVSRVSCVSLCAIAATMSDVAFSFSMNPQRHITPSTTALFGVNRKKGNLTKNISSGGVSTKSKTKSSTGAGSAAKPVQVSSSLSQWAATLDGATAPTSTVATATKDSTTLPPEKNTKQTKKGKQDTSSSSTSRRERSQLRQAENAAKTAQINTLLANIQELISSNNLDVDDLLGYIQQLINEGSQTSFKALLNQKAGDYSLSWVGSDEAICHLGTGLHKVPLARLQDIFFTIGRDGSGQTKTVQVMEVIRILGPFPNVRNTLQGSVVEMKKGENGEDVIKICYDSMMDGLGKEISAGKEGNLRYVDLNVLYADENAIVCVVPSEEDYISRPFGEKGKNVLLFIKEDDLSYRLEELRAA
jgi:hypothetical protein